MGRKKAKKAAQNSSPTTSPFGRWFLGHIFSLIRRHGNLGITWFGAGWCAYQARAVLIAYAGKQSIGKLSVSVLANLHVVFVLSITVGGTSVMLYLRERRLHRRTRDRLTDRVSELELKLDPSRTSSLLTPEGLTRKEDE